MLAGDRDRVGAGGGSPLLVLHVAFERGERVVDSAQLALQVVREDCGARCDLVVLLIHEAAGGWRQ